MAENLRTTRFADGTTIPLWAYGVAGPACFAPGNGSSNEENTDNVDRYGYLYNWAAVMHGASSSSAVPSGVQGICPTGWHVPSDAEWTELTTYLSSQSQYLLKRRLLGPLPSRPNPSPADDAVQASQAVYCLLPLALVQCLLSQRVESISQRLGGI